MPKIINIFIAAIVVALPNYSEAKEAAKEITNDTELVPENKDRAEKGVFVSSIQFGVIRPPTPAPFNREGWASNGGTWYPCVETVYPEAPDPTELKLKVLVTNNTNETISKLSLAYALKINGTAGTPIVTQQNKEKIIPPNTSGEFEISIQVGSKKQWEELSKLEVIAFRLYSGETLLNLGNRIWLKK